MWGVMKDSPIYKMVNPQDASDLRDFQKNINIHIYLDGRTDTRHTY